MWVPKFSTQLFVISKVHQSRTGFRAPKYSLKAKKEGDEIILKGKRFLRRDLQTVDADTDPDWKPKADLIKRAETTRGRGRPQRPEATDALRDEWDKLWKKARPFTNRTGKDDLKKPGRIEQLQREEPEIKAMFESFIAKHTENAPLKKEARAQFAKLKRILAEGIVVRTYKR
jgi:hypothetical protein